MTNLASFARPYARALFSEAVAQGQVQDWQAKLDVLADVIASDELQPVVRSKVITRERKLAAVAGSLGEESILVNLFSLLVRNDRLSVTKAIAMQFAELRRQHEQQQAITVTTPYSIGRDVLQQITQRLQQRMNSKLVITTEVDPSLIAGIRISGQGWLIEGNMQAQLAQLANRLTA